MDGRIEHLRSHYRLVGPRTAPALVTRLDRVLPRSGLACYEAALQEALADDESVYVLRRVHAPMTLVLREELTDSALARVWGTRVAKSVLHAIAAAADSPGNLVQFENQADYVAHFLVALLKGTQHGQWFYDAFGELTTLDRESAIKRVLLDNQTHLPLILGYVHRYGALDSLISALDAETKRMLWSADSAQRDDLELGRPLFIMALQFVDQFAGWARVPRDGEELFRDYLETEPQKADWRDPRSLAVAVFEVVRFLFIRGYLVIGEALSAELKSRLVGALKDFEWLDRDWFAAAVTNLFGRSQEAIGALPVRPLKGAATPRQQELLSKIAAVLSDAGVVDWSAMDSDTAALKLLGLLVDASPGWADDTTGKVILQNLITTWSATREAVAPAEFLERLRQSDVAGALRLLRSNESERTRDACRQMANLGEPALALVEKLSGGAVASTFAGVESNCAGVSLLLRSFLEARLHIVTNREAYPRGDELPHVAMMLLLVGSRLGGKNDVANGCFDEDICLLAGLDSIPEAESLCSSWSKSEPSDHLKFQNALLGIAAGQRLIEPATMHVFGAKLASGEQAIVAGDQTGKVWPLGQVVESEDEIAVVVRDWQLAWKEATGIMPGVFSGDSVISSMLEQDPGTCLTADPEMQAAHTIGQKELLLALDVLTNGQTGRSGLDLTITIVSCLLLRTWTRWLRGFSDSSVPFLIENFMRRPGRLQLHGDGLMVELERGPLDLIIEMAGYLGNLENVPWIPGGRVRFFSKECR